MIIDSHSHLNFEEFNDDWQQVVADCQKKDIWIINVGSQLATSKKAAEISDSYNKGVYAAVGLHPIHVSGSSFSPEAFNVDEYKVLLSHYEKIVAVGETGLDFFHDQNNADNQKKVLIKHIKLAGEFELPLILHSRNSKDRKRDAYNEILDIIAVELRANKKLRGVIHCFGGNAKQAEAFLKLGFYIGFTGIITFAKGNDLVGVVQSVPLDRILIETDCPYLAPEPYRGKRNIPQYVEFVAQKIAEIKKINYNNVRKQTVENAIQLFNLN